MPILRLYRKQKIVLPFSLFPESCLGDTALGNDAVQMWVQLQVLAPGVQHRDRASFAPRCFGSFPKAVRVSPGYRVHNCEGRSRRAWPTLTGVSGIWGRSTAPAPPFVKYHGKVVLPFYLRKKDALFILSQNPVSGTEPVDGMFEKARCWKVSIPIG